MAEGVKLTRDFAERAANVVRAFERQSLNIPGPGLKKPLPLPSTGGETINLYHNDPGQTVPPWGCMAVSGFEMHEETPTLKIVKPSTTFHWDYVFNDDTEFEYEGRKTLRVLRFPKALYNTGTPAHDEGYGATPGQWYLTKNYPEILRVKGIVDSDEKIVYGKQFDLLRVVIKNSTGSSIAANTSGSFTIQGGAVGSEASAGYNTVSMRNRGSIAFANNKIGQGELLNGLWYAMPWECP